MKTKSFYYLASYPRSGNTWCRLFVYELFKSKFLSLNINQKYPDFRKLGQYNNSFKFQSIISSRQCIDDQIGFDSSDLKMNELDTYRPNLELGKIYGLKNFNLLKVHDAFTSPFNGGNPVMPINGCKGVIYLVRNPIDIIASLSEFYQWDVQKTIEFIIDNRAGLCDSSKSCSNFVRQYMGSWAFHVKSWTNQEELPILVVRYEDLVKSPYKYFPQIAEFLELSSNKKEINNAIRKTTFEKLKNNQVQYEAFIEKPSSCKEFFWKGLLGEGEKIINNLQRDKIIASLGDVMEFYSYI